MTQHKKTATEVMAEMDAMARLMTAPQEFTIKVHKGHIPTVNMGLEKLRGMSGVRADKIWVDEAKDMADVTVKGHFDVGREIADDIDNAVLKSVTDPNAAMLFRDAEGCDDMPAEMPEPEPELPTFPANAMKHFGHKF